MKKPLLFALFLFSLYFAQRSNAQCYVRLDDASGFNTDAYQADLQAAAAKLCAIFDTTGFAGQFKVYDFGFYLHQENTTGGYPEPFAQKIQEVQALSPYYLLFGKQTDRTGVYTRFWVDLVLPDTGRFTCLDNIDPAFREILYQKAKITTALVYESVNSASEKYHVAELATIDTIQNILDRVLSCCYYQPGGGSGCTLCLFDADDIKRYFEDKGFLALEITITPGVLRGDSVGNIIESKLSNNIILHDYFDKVIGIFDGQYNIGQAVKGDFLNYPPESLNMKILVSDNKTFCLYFSEIDGDLANNTYDIFACMHIWSENITSNSGLLFFKISDYNPSSSDSPYGYIYHDDVDLDDLIDFDSIKSSVEQIFANNTIFLPVEIGDFNPLRAEDCWIKVVNIPIPDAFTSDFIYNRPGNTATDDSDDQKTQKERTYASYQSIIKPSMNKSERSYSVAYIIAHEFLHQMLIKAYLHINSGFGTIVPKDVEIGLHRYSATNIFKSDHGLHFDCWYNLNTSGPHTEKITPMKAGENPQLELILPSHQTLLNENQKLLNWKSAFGLNSPTFKIKAIELYGRLHGTYSGKYEDGYIKYLNDVCSEPTQFTQMSSCNCGY